MDLSSFLHVLQSSGVADAIRNSLYLFPLIEAVHVIGATLVFGTVMIVDLRLLGFASSERAYNRIVADMMTWTWGAFVLAAVSGFLMFITNAHGYADNGFFRAKLVLLVLAGINMGLFEFFSHRTLHHWDTAPSAPAIGKTAAVLSLVLWVGVIFMGRLTGFTISGGEQKEPPPPSNVNFDDFLAGGPGGNSAGPPPPTAVAPAK